LEVLKVYIRIQKMYLARNGRELVFGQDDFIPLFTTSLKSKAETVISIMGRTQRTDEQGDKIIFGR